MASTCAIGYHNWAFELECIAYSLFGSIEPSAPLSNLLTPILGQKAIAATDGPTGFAVDWSNGSPTVGARVDIVALLNHNILEAPSNIGFGMYDADGGSFSPSGLPIELFGFGTDGSFQSHLVWVMGANDTPGLNRDRVYYVGWSFPADTITGSKNPYTGEVTRERLSMGAVWAGPSFAPRRGIAIDGLNQSIADNSQVARSIGGQVWAEPETRQRRCKINFAGLYESEVFALAPNSSLQQLAAHCGLSRPMIAIPTTSSDELIYTQAVYGYAASPPTYSLIEKADDYGSKVRFYDAEIEIIEAR